MSLKAERDFGVGQCCCREFHSIVFSAFPGSGIHIPKVFRVAEPKQHITENAVITEHILCFQIGSRAPAVYNCQELIFPFPQLIRQVKLCRIVRSLGITDKFPVPVQVQAACHSQKRNHSVLAGVVNLHRSAIHTYKIIFFSRILPAWAEAPVKSHPGEHFPDFFFCWDHRRMVRKLIPGIHIERFVISSELPACRNIYSVERNLIRVKNIR